MGVGREGEKETSDPLWCVFVSACLSPSVTIARALVNNKFNLDLLLHNALSWKTLWLANLEAQFR